MPSVFVMRPPSVIHANITDDFNRTSSTTVLGGGWGTSFPVGFSGTAGPLGISSNKAYYASVHPVSNGKTQSSGVTQACASPDGTLTVKVSENTGNTNAQATSGDYFGLIFRRAPGGSFFLLTFNALYFHTSPSSGTQVGSSMNAPPAWPNVLGTSILTPRVELAGSSIKVYNDAGTLCGSFTDTRNMTETQHGIWTYYDGVFNASGVQIRPRLDDFSFVS